MQFRPVLIFLFFKLGIKSVNSWFLEKQRRFYKLFPVCFIFYLFVFIEFVFILLFYFILLHLILAISHPGSHFINGGGNIWIGSNSYFLIQIFSLRNTINLYRYKTATHLKTMIRLHNHAEFFCSLCFIYNLVLFPFITGLE